MADTIIDTRSSVDLLISVDFLRIEASRRLEAGRKVDLGQFFTPMPVAQLMSSMLEHSGTSVHILDAGAGVGTLFAACVADLCARTNRPQQVHVTAYELDEMLIPYLNTTSDLCREACTRVGIDFMSSVIHGDFINSAVRLVNGDLFNPLEQPAFTCAILNPPYKKIHSTSTARKSLRQLGIETTNLYAGFLAAAIHLLAPGGELAAITPRSFCNGPYFKPFRQTFLSRMALRRLHIFETRDEAFSDDDVLQENVIVSAVKSSATSPMVDVSASTGPQDKLIFSRDVPYDEVVHPDDPQQFIHIVPSELGRHFNERMSRFRCRLHDLGLSVSTGRVVDFRARDHLRMMPNAETAPLIYPTHVSHGYVQWPKLDSRKPNALAIDDPILDQLVPNENYVLVKRFSSKEEPRRVVAAVYDADLVPGQFVGFENHLNYFHQNGKGLPLTLARGLAAFLNSTIVDAYFRQFSGHTQVNATDLRNLRYPSLGELEAIGARIGAAFPIQDIADDLIQEGLFSMPEDEGRDPVSAQHHIEDAKRILREIGFSGSQVNDRSALTLLALAGMKPDTSWEEASAQCLTVTQTMNYIREHYGRDYKPNSRESFRDETLQHFVTEAFVVKNPDKPDRATTSQDTCYELEPAAVDLLLTFGTNEWESELANYRADYNRRAERARHIRETASLHIDVGGQVVPLSGGGQNLLIQHIIQKFVPQFAPGAEVLSIDGTGAKDKYLNATRLAGLGIHLSEHAKKPDVILYYPAKGWLVVVEAVTSGGEISQLRRKNLQELFAGSQAPLVYVTAFDSRSSASRFLSRIAWATEVWIADAPAHLIHFNGTRFLGPYEESTHMQGEEHG